MIQSSAVSINLQDKGQVYIDGQSQQIHLFLQCLCFKCHPLMNLVQKYTSGFDEMSVLFSADQIRWMKVKQEQKYYFCHLFFYALQEVDQSVRFLLNKYQSLHNITHWSISQQAMAFMSERTHNSNTTEDIEMPMTGLKSVFPSFYLPSHSPQINLGCWGRALQKHFHIYREDTYS